MYAIRSYYGIDGELWVHYRREKTTKVIRIPLLPKALQIIEMYKNNHKSRAQGSIFPKISNQKLNSYLKEIADVCGINKNLTFHIARHTVITSYSIHYTKLYDYSYCEVVEKSKISTKQLMFNLFQDYKIV